MAIDYKTKDYESIKERMKEKISADTSTAEGSLVDFALSGAAAEIEETYNDIENVEQNARAKTADREHLELIAAESGIEPKAATCAEWKAVFNVDFEVGERFAAGDMTYISISKVEDLTYLLQCEVEGAEGNEKPDDELTPIEYIEGYDTGELTELIVSAVDEEDTEVFRTRYEEEMKNPNVSSGNKPALKKEMKEINGVSLVKIKRVTETRKHIEIYFLDSTYGVPAAELVSKAQENIDPLDAQGEGEGAAAIWQVVDVKAATATTINITSNITLDTGYTWDNVKEAAEAAVDAYLLSLAKTWEEEANLVVRVLQIEKAIVNVDGIIDLTGTTLNGSIENITLDNISIPVRGELTNDN